ncbi:hypothetical protein L837_5195 [Mycobacterium avium MAV_061107_1842]|nr:hypothetical protein L837_5195 [Mycobacterium avium MAV_061107_1842]
MWSSCNDFRSERPKSDRVDHVLTDPELNGCRLLVEDIRIGCRRIETLLDPSEAGMKGLVVREHWSRGLLKRHEFFLLKLLSCHEPVTPLR